jgi:tetratricopeptide (TPR) repeat protein
LAGGSSEESNLRRAMILLEKGSLEESMSAFEEVASQDPRSGDAFHGLSKVCLFGNNPQAALRMSEAAVGLDATNGIYLYQLGVVLKALGRNQEAVQRLEEAERRGADAFGVTFDLGDAYRKSGEMEKARQALARYQSLLEEKRRNQEVLQLANQGDEELQRGDRAAAQETFRRLVQIDPDNWDGHNRLAKTALSANRFDQAMIHVERMLQIDPESSEAHFLAALCRNAKSDRKQALYHAEESKRLRPGNAALRNLLGNLYFAEGDWTRSKEEYQASSSLEPDNPVFRANLESAVRRAGQ